MGLPRRSWLLFLWLAVSPGCGDGQIMSCCEDGSEQDGSPGAPRTFGAPATTNSESQNPAAPDPTQDAPDDLVDPPRNPQAETTPSDPGTLPAEPKGAYFAEDFDSWPDGGCQDGGPTSACNGSSISGGASVGAFPQCLSGKCWRGQWPANETESRFLPEAGFQRPAYDTFFGRIYLRIGADFADGAPYNFKIHRLISESGSELDVYTWGNEFAMNNTNHCGDCDIGEGGLLCRIPFVPEDHIGEWVKLEWYWKHNSSASNHDGECRLWATYEDDSVDSDSSLNLKLLPDPRGL